jgi:hypothetical protein
VLGLAGLAQAGFKKEKAAETARKAAKIGFREW